MQLADNEIEREARRVLRSLTLAGAELAPLDDDTYALMSPTRRGQRQRLRVPREHVLAFRRRDWIVPLAEGSLCYVLSDAGQGWIRRAFAAADPFGSQHRLENRREIAGDIGATQAVIVNDGESPLGWLFRRRGPDGRPLISEAQFHAGERLRTDFTLAQLTPRLGVDLSAPVVAGRRGAKSDAPIPDIVLAAKQRLARALGAVGPELAGILVDVCCHLIGLEAAERQKGWPQRTAKIVLQIALDRLAAHYGIGVAVGAGARLRAWHAPEDERDMAREP